MRVKKWLKNRMDSEVNETDKNRRRVKEINCGRRLDDGYFNFFQQKYTC